MLVQKLIGRFRKSAAALKKCFTASEIESQFVFLDKLNRVIDEHEKEIPPRDRVESEFTEDDVASGAVLEDLMKNPFEKEEY